MSELLYRALGNFRYKAARLLHARGGTFHGSGLIGPGCRITISSGGTLEIGTMSMLAGDDELYAGGLLRLGEYVVINRHTRIMAVESITIGNNLRIAQFVTILDHAYNIVRDSGGNMRYEGFVTAPIVIGNNVWIGDKATVLKGVTIGDNVIVGANSVVNRDIPPNCLAAGNPARVVKQL